MADDFNAPERRVVYLAHVMRDKYDYLRSQQDPRYVRAKGPDALMRVIAEQLEKNEASIAKLEAELAAFKAKVP